MNFINKLFEQIKSANNKTVYGFKVAGVTSKNDDGTSRQKFIKLLKLNDPIILSQYKFNNEDAIYVKNSRNEILGNVELYSVKMVNDHINSKIIYKVQVDEVGSFKNENDKLIYFLKVKYLVK